MECAEDYSDSRSFSSLSMLRPLSSCPSGVSESMSSTKTVSGRTGVRRTAVPLGDSRRMIAMPASSSQIWTSPEPAVFCRPSIRRERAKTHSMLDSLPWKVRLTANGVRRVEFHGCEERVLATRQHQADDGCNGSRDDSPGVNAAPHGAKSIYVL